MTEAVEEAGSWIYKMLITLVVAIVAVAIVGAAVHVQINTIDLQRELLFARVLGDPNGIWYVDGAGVAHPGEIDLQRLEQRHLDATFQYPDGYGGASLSVVTASGKTTGTIDGTTYTAIASHVGAGIQGSGSVVTRSYPVLVRDGTSVENGWLVIAVAMPEVA